MTSKGPVLGPRALNRATLARQMLLERVDLGVHAAVERLVGMQAQAPFPPYFGLWTRLSGFAAEALADAIVDRSVVRIVLMRGTVHLVTAADAAELRTLTRPVLERGVRVNSQYTRNLTGLDLDAVAEAARAELEREPMTGAALGTVLAERWPDRDPASLAFAARGLLPLVQTPPRAVWGRSGQAVLTTLRAWTGLAEAAEPSVERMVRRYLAAFGPATVADIQTWSGLTGLREVVRRLRPELAVFADEAGRELFDLPDAPRPGPDTVAPVRFLAPFDNILLSHADRTRVIGEAEKAALYSKNGIVPGTVLVDGFVRALWDTERRRGVATLTVRPTRPLSKRHAAAVAAEGRRLLAFAEPGADERRVILAEPA